MEPLRLAAGGLPTEGLLRTHWETFQQAGAIAAGVRPEIAASWQRSLRARLITAIPAPPIDESALRGVDHAGPARRRFLVNAAAVADELVSELSDAAAAIVVCDDFGVVLHRAGPADVLRRAEGVNLVPGGVWNEKMAGTTGIGLALATGSAAHVHGAEHYVEVLHAFSCTAAVIRHPVTRESLGVLSLASGTDVPATFTRPLIARASLEVERRLRDELHGRERELMERYLDRRADRETPFLTVDHAGHTVIQSARMVQSASGEDVSLLLELARAALHTATDTTEELELSRGRMRAEIRLVRNGSETLGALVSLRRAGPRRPAARPATADDWEPMVGRSPAMQRLFREAGRVARARASVAIWGEAGSGKLSLARGLHRLGGTGPLTLVPCAQPDWERVFTGAGAQAGTVVLRRVHVLGADSQLVLCDHLDELVRREAPVWVIALLGAHSPQPCPELLSRLARVSLTMPALADRGHDLRLLVERWCDERERSTGTRPALRADAHEALAARRWPGNVRELRNALDAAALRGGTVIGVESLNLDAEHREGTGAQPPAALSLRDLEREAIEAALRRTGGNVSRAARELGIGRATLHRRLRAYRLLP